jgi:hypothetical protein
MGRLRPYPQTLDFAGKACQGQTQFYYKKPKITVVEILKDWPGANVIKLFTAVSYGFS